TNCPTVRPSDARSHYPTPRWVHLTTTMGGQPTQTVQSTIAFAVHPTSAIRRRPPTDVVHAASRAHRHPNRRYAAPPTIDHPATLGALGANCHRWYPTAFGHPAATKQKPPARPPRESSQHFDRPDKIHRPPSQA